MVWLWKGRPLEEFTKWELIGIVVELWEIYEGSLKQHSKDLDFLTFND